MSDQNNKSGRRYDRGFKENAVALVLKGRAQSRSSHRVPPAMSLGIIPHRESAPALARTVRTLLSDDETTQIVEHYIRHFVMPRNPLGNANHLALASPGELRLLTDLELPALGEREQVSAH